ncbi:MAG: RHS repeat-associated core domain-containing protein [Pseudomonadota bacterium]
MSTDDGVTWEDLSGKFETTSSGQWTRATLDLSAYAGQSVRIGFYFETHGYSEWNGYKVDVSTGWYIDEVELRTGPDRFNDPEDFEASWGDWSTDSYSVWQIGEPTSGPPIINESRAHSPVSVAATKLNGNYSANVNGRLLSPRFTVPSVAGDERVILRFWQWYQYGTGDSGTVQIKGEYDTEWMDQHIAASSGTLTEWQIDTVDLTAYQGQEVQIGFFHSANSDASVGAGWYIDDLSLSRTSPSRLALNDESPASRSFTENKQGQYFIIQVPPGGHLRIDLDDLDGEGINELYIRRGALPTPGSYDYKFKTTGADQSIFIPDAGAGDWFILAYNDSGPLPGDYTLEAETSQGIMLEALEPTQTGNTASGAVRISGAGFTPDSTVVLLSGNSAYSATDVAVVSSSSIVAEFDFTTIPPGSYTLRVTSKTSTGDLPFSIFAGGEPKLTTHIIVPRTVGYHNVATIWVEYANEGDVAMPAPLLEVSGQQNGRRAAILTLDESRLVQGFWTSAMPVGFSNSVQFLGHGKTPGILQPGESGRVPIYYAGWQRPYDFRYPPIRFDLSVLTADNAATIDWEALKDFMRPPGISAEAWESVFNNLAAQTGDTWGDYVRMLNHNAQYLSKLGQTVTDIRDLLSFEIMQAIGLNLSGMLSSSVDAQVEAPGVSLSFTRSFGTDIPSRFEMGRLGRGWSDNWSLSLSVADDGTVTMKGPNRSKRVFQPDSRNASYFSENGDHAILTSLGGGALSLTESDGSLYVFRSDGKLDYKEDTHNNRITCIWSGEQLTRLSHSAGPFLDFGYTGSLISSVTDSLGRQTTLTYDDAGEHLLSTTDYLDKTTTYAYGTGAADEHALTSVVHPDGTQTTYIYDGFGRLSKKTGCCGSPECTIHTYDDAGKVTATDALGNASQFYLDHRERICRTVNPLGHVTSRVFDADGNLIQATDPAGGFQKFEYDERGHLSSETDALGNITRYNYTTFDRLATITDAKGNVTRYEYESDGDLASITYADGREESWSYDTGGNRLSWTNRRGQTITYSNNMIGQLTARSYPDGTIHAFNYDEKGDLASYTDPLGTTTRAYDDQGRLEKITYPGGRWLQYTYDEAGRRASMTDQLGHRTNYQYDAQGRLATLTDESGEEIVRYEYDAAGRESRKTLGNGVYTTYTYDAAGQVLALSNLKPDGSILSRFAYTYDSRGRRTTMTTTYGEGDPRTDLAGTWTYDYDDTGQLIGWTAPDGRRVDYTYDALGNRVNVSDNGTDTAYLANNLNQYTQAGEERYQYDADGNLISQVTSEGTITYEWSADNKLLRVSKPEGVWENFYDANGNRVGIADDGGVRNYIFDPVGAGNIVSEYQQGDVSPIARFDHGRGLLLRRNPSGVASFYSFDAIGSASDIIDTTNTIQGSYVYQPFGKLLFDASSFGNPFQFVGAFGVAVSDGNLNQMRDRFYDASIGRFLSTDPIGIDAGINTYMYAQNNPVIFIDPLGKQASVGTNTCWQIYQFNSGLCNSGVTPIDQICIGNAYRLFLQCLYSWDDSPPGGRRCKKCIERCTPQTGCYQACVEVPCSGGNNGGDSGIPDIPSSGGGGSGSSSVARPKDPNDLLGPAGYGPLNYLVKTDLLPYRINFENESGATAPAQIVSVSNQLSTNFDWPTFELTEIAFGDRFIAVPPGTRHFTAVEKMTYNEVTFEVHIEAGISLSTGEVYARFTALDPLTGLPPAVEIGFLPPEDGTGRGQGHISYTIRSQSSLAEGTEIRNIALIVFDGQPAIATNLVDPHDPSKGTDPDKEALVTIAPDAVSLIVESTTGGGVISPAETSSSHGWGERVVLKAAADTGYRFTGWTGNVDTIDDITAAETTLMMYGDFSITANFESDVIDVALRKGFNLISIPGDISAKPDLKDWLADLGDNTDIEKVLGYDPQAGKYVALVPGNPDNPSFTLKGGDGLIVNAKKEKIVTFDHIQCLSYNLVPGTNLIGIACPESGYTAFKFLEAHQGQHVTSIQRFAADKGAFETAGIDPQGIVAGIDFPIVAGEGYIVMKKE